MYATVGVFIKDTKDIIQIFSMFGMYMVPLVFLPQRLPKAVQLVVLANPFTYLVFVYQDILFFGKISHPIAWLIFPTISLVSLLLGRSLVSLQHSLRT